MLLPMIPEIPQDRRYLQEFKGYNRHERVGEGEFTDICNMTNDEYPVLSTRAKRYSLDHKFTYIAGMASLDGHLYVLGLSTEDANDTSLHFYKDGDRLTDPLGLWIYDVEKGPRHVVANGMSIFVFPDKVYFDTNTNETKPMEAITFPLGLKDGITRVNDLWQENDNGDIVQFTATVDYGSFHVGDIVDFVIHKGEDPFYQQLDGETQGSFAIVDIDGSTIRLRDEGALKQVIGNATAEDSCWIVRRIPDMDFVTAFNNKIYGVKWGVGETENGNTVDEIYISSGSDVFDFYDKAGGTAITVGEPGEFTGIAPFNGSVYAFKRDCAIRISGTYPNVSTQILHVPSVAKGAEKSIAYHDGYLYYKGEMGVYRFNGEYATLVSDAFGARRYTGGVGAFLGDKYYLAVTGNPSDEKIEKVTRRKLNTGGILGPIAALINLFIGLADKIKGIFLSIKFPLFVFDAARGMWQIETLSGITSLSTNLITVMTYSEGVLYVARADGTIDAIADSKPQYESSTIESDFDWWCQTGCLGYDSPDEKHVGRILIRLRLKQTTEVDFKIRYDDAEEWESVAKINDVGIKTVVVPIIPRRCDVYQIRIEGKGECKIYGVTTTLEGGSDVQWHL